MAAGLTAHLSTDIRALISSLSQEERAALLSAPAPSGTEDSEGSTTKTANKRESAADVKDTAASGQAAEAMDTGDQVATAT